MKDIILGITLTSLLFTSTLLYSFCSGKIELNKADYATQLSDRRQ